MILTEEQLKIISDPISDECHVGVDLRADSSSRSIYYEMKDQRNAARTAERQVMNGIQDANALPCWKVVKEKAIDVLSSKSKDLEVVAWLIEALLRTDGYKGLALGFEIAHIVVSNYWDDVYPLPDEDGIATKVAPFVWLNGDNSDGTLATPMKNVPILTLVSGESLVMWQYEQAQVVERISDPEKKKQRFEEGAIEMKVIEESINQTPASDFTLSLNHIQQCLDNYQILCSDFEARCEEEHIPPSSNIKSTLLDIQRSVSALSHEVVLRSQPVAEEFNNEEPGSSDVHQAKTSVTDRESAMRTLLSVAEYFRRTEPQSPLPYLLERAVRWGRMSLGDLLKEVILDERVRKDVFQLTGIDANNQTE